jgi:hypothetical protein
MCFQTPKSQQPILVQLFLLPSIKCCSEKVIAQKDPGGTSRPKYAPAAKSSPLIRGTLAPTSVLLRYMRRLEVNLQLILDSTVVLAFQVELTEVE